jgi:glycerol kinase
VLALDQGTTSSRAVVFGRDGTVLGKAQYEVHQHYPQPGWVEHDPEEIWTGQLKAGRDALAIAGVEAEQLAAIGIANQRETSLLWDCETGTALGNAIVWQCRRTAERCDQLRRSGWDPRIREKTGLRLDPYFSATKLEWLLSARADARWLMAQGRLRAGTVDSFLMWRLTRGRSFVTDYSNASRTMLFGLRSLDWDDELLKVFGVPREILPQPCLSSAVLGVSDPQWFGAAVPIAGLAGDQQAALFGQDCLKAGDTKNTYGTGCFLLMNVGTQPVTSRHGLLSTVAWGLSAGVAAGAAAGAQVTYALEGSVFVAGAAVQWLRDEMGLIEAAADIGPLATQVPDNGGLYFVPAMAGLGAPYWDPYARGLLVGITRGTGRAHLARATEESICLQTRAVLDAMTQDTGGALSSLRADGGATGDDFLLQLQADLLGVRVERSRVKETTALGAAALAGLAVGFWSRDDISALAGADQTFLPSMSSSERERLYREWQRAAERALGWAERTSEQAPETKILLSSADGARAAR